MRTTILLLGFVLLTAGCGQTDVANNANSAKTPAAPEPWQVEYARLTNSIKIGMSEAEVRQAVGEPARDSAPMNSPGKWEYNLPGHLPVQVRFDRSNRVGRVEIASTTPIN